MEKVAPSSSLPLFKTAAATTTAGSIHPRARDNDDDEAIVANGVYHHQSDEDGSILAEPPEETDHLLIPPFPPPPINDAVGKPEDEGNVKETPDEEATIHHDIVEALLAGEPTATTGALTTNSASTRTNTINAAPHETSRTVQPDDDDASHDDERNSNNNNNSSSSTIPQPQEEESEQQQLNVASDQDPAYFQPREPPLCCICQRHDVKGTPPRPMLRFEPAEHPVLVNHHNLHPAGAEDAVMIPTTLSQTIVMHVFCGKTAGILPHVDRPDLEVLTKAGIKNKHGIGQHVNAAIARTRSAVPMILANDDNNSNNNNGNSTNSENSKTKTASSTATVQLVNNANKEKQFYLVGEFEAHFASLLHLKHGVTHYQQQQRLQQRRLSTMSTMSNNSRSTESSEENDDGAVLETATSPDDPSGYYPDFVSGNNNTDTSMFDASHHKRSVGAGNRRRKRKNDSTHNNNNGNGSTSKSKKASRLTCVCGGTHWSTDASHQSHLQTKKHQKYLKEQVQLLYRQQHATAAAAQQQQEEEEEANNMEEDETVAVFGHDEDHRMLLHADVNHHEEEEEEDDVIDHPHLHDADNHNSDARSAEI